MATHISENEEKTETETNKTKVSDSGYSNSCSNSQSQRSISSKSRHSTSSGSSGYCGHPSSTLGSSGDETHKKKKTKVEVNSTITEIKDTTTTNETSFTLPHPAKAAVKKIIPTSYMDPSDLDNMSSPTFESEALQVAVLAQTLCCIKTKTSEQPLDESYNIIPIPSGSNLPHTTQMTITDFKDDIKLEKEFCIVVSLSDGTVICTTPSLTEVLGFPKDMWIGRSLINFLHPKDRLAFASHITSAMAHSHFKQKDTTINLSDKSEDSDYFYCWIRLYNGLQAGFGVADKKAVYLPCQLTMSFKEVPDQGVFLVATARLVKSAYKGPDEKQSNPSTFTIRHTANTLISHVDNAIVPHFGYLPHDMIGRSIFDFYYAEDLPYLKDVYTNVIMEEGLLFLSRPYKFRCQNGDCVMVETEWSSFINPWGKKLEFIIGRHRVLKGPHNPDVVSPTLESEVATNNEEDEAESKFFQEEIKVLLTEPIIRCYEPSKKQLAQLVESLEKISSSHLLQQSAGVSAPIPSAVSEMLGEISPHHVYSGSKSSSETPSYNQLTYNENIHRFFASEPKTIGSDDTKNEQIQSSSSGGEEGKSQPNNSSLNSNSGSYFTSGISSNSGKVDRSKPQEGLAGIATSDPSLVNTRPLTEEMLYQHNENMNKQMAQKHKKDKKGQVNRKHKSAQNKTEEENEQEEPGGHGMKRGVSHSWEGEAGVKAFKGEQPELTLHSSGVLRLQPDLAPAVWPDPPFSVNIPPPVQPHTNYSSPLVNPIMQLPCVYVPGPSAVACGPSRASEHHCPPPIPLGLHRPPLQLPAPQPFQVQYMPSLMYQLPLVPMVYTQPHIVPTAFKPRMTYMPNIPQMTPLPQQPSSAATSIKGEPGSALCSFASASLKQALSDSSKKENKSCASSPVYSPGGFTSATGKTKTDTYDNDLTMDDTSYCSYSSLFPKTEKSDDSMRASEDKENVGPYKTWRKTAGSDTSTVLRTLRKEPSWLENVDVTSDLMLRYQMGGNILNQVLQSDLEALLKLNQPDLVNEQLDQLYVDLEGLSKHLSLEESFPSSCSSGDEKHMAATYNPSTSTSTYVKAKKKKRFMGHDKCAMIFEEDAPLPPSFIELLAVTAQSS